MFRYKSVKHKSNYLCVKIPFNVNGFSQTEYTLVLPLFGGEHSVSTRFEVGNGYTGEAVFHYAYDKGVIKVCSYDWDKKDEIPYEVPPHYTRPHLNLYKADSNSQEKIMTVSSDNSTALRCNANDSFLLNAIEPIKANLRTIHDYVQEAVKKTGVSLSTHVDDIVEKDEAGNIVGGIAIGFSSNWTGFFYNIDGSTDDTNPLNCSWIDYYEICLGYSPNDKHYFDYCASNGIGLKCSEKKANPRRSIGGHIHTFLSLWLRAGSLSSDTRTVNSKDYWYHSGLLREGHKMPDSKTAIYYMLPICSRHNNRSHYDVVMYAKNEETLLVLNNFMH